MWPSHILTRSYEEMLPGDGKILKNLRNSEMWDVPLAMWLEHVTIFRRILISTRLSVMLDKSLFMWHGSYVTRLILINIDDFIWLHSYQMTYRVLIHVTIYLRTSLFLIFNTSLVQADLKLPVKVKIKINWLFKEVAIRICKIFLLFHF